MTDLDNLIKIIIENPDLPNMVKENKNGFRIGITEKGKLSIQEYQSLYEKLKKTLDKKWVCGRCFDLLSVEELGRNYYGEILCHKCYTVGKTLNEEIKELKLNQKTPDDIEKIKKYDEHEDYKELFEKFQRENIKFQTENQQLKKYYVELTNDNQQLKEELTTSGKLFHAVKIQRDRLEQDSKNNAKMVERLESEINRTLYLMNTISPNIKCGQSTYDVYEEFLNKLKLIKSGGM